VANPNRMRQLTIVQPVSADTTYSEPLPPVSEVAAQSALQDFRDAWTEQFRYRDLLLQLATRDLLLRYKQTVIGIAWALFVPLLNTLIFSLLFMRVAPIRTTVPYPLFAYMGLVAWNLTAAALRSATTSLTSNPTLVSKVYFPREVFPFAALLVALVDTLVACVILVGMMLLYHIAPGPLALLVPVVIAIQLVFTAALGLLLAMGNLFYRDVKYLFDAVLTIWMLASSVVYPVGIVGGRLGEVMSWNPMAVIIDAYRALVFSNTLPPVAPLAAIGIGSLVLLVVTWVMFHRAEFVFAERI
jgi:homopolymeric O-antigen transport system permease protein